MSDFPTHRITKVDSIGTFRQSYSQLTPLKVTHWLPESSDHRPKTQLFLAYTIDGLVGRYEVADRYVRCFHRGYQARVFNDSCVELFIWPKAEKGYFNFEFNCGGEMLAYYIYDWTQTDSGRRLYTRLTEEECESVKRFPSLLEAFPEEIADPVFWTLEIFIPFAVLEKYVGPLRPLRGTTWRANLNKCADETSHPHWGTWSPVQIKNFHRPHRFGYLEFL